MQPHLVGHAHDQVRHKASRQAGKQKRKTFTIISDKDKDHIFWQCSHSCNQIQRLCKMKYLLDKKNPNDGNDARTLASIKPTKKKTKNSRLQNQLFKINKSTCLSVCLSFVFFLSYSKLKQAKTHSIYSFSFCCLCCLSNTPLDVQGCLSIHPTIHPTIHLFLLITHWIPLWGYGAAGANKLLGEGRATPWTSRQSITGSHPHSHSHLGVI